MRVLVMMTVACVLGLTACDDSVSGIGNTKSDPAGGNTAAAPDGKKGTPLKGTDPCTLLKAADVPQLHQDDYFKPKSISGKHPACAGYDFSLKVIDNDPNAHDLDFHSSGTEPLPDIDGYRAVIRKVDTGALKDCSVSMDVTADEYVHIQVTHSEDPSKACDLAKKSASVVAGRIPA